MKRQKKIYLTNNTSIKIGNDKLTHLKSVNSKKVKKVDKVFHLKGKLMDYVVNIVSTNPSQKLSTVTTKFLHSICPDFAMIQNMVDDSLVKKGKGNMQWNIETANKTRMLKGEMQSCKSRAITTTALYYLLEYRISTFIVVQNSIDACNQLKDRIFQVFDDYKDILHSNNVKKTFKKLFKVLDVRRGKVTNKKEISRAMSGKVPKIFILLRNTKDIDSINKMIGETKNKRFVTIIDESDENDSGVESLVQHQLQTLKDHSNLVWDVTATPLTNLVKDDIEQGYVGILSTPPAYKGLPMVNFKNLVEECSYYTKITHDPFEMDLNLTKYLDDFSKTTPYSCDIYNEKHPVYSLVRSGNTIEPQLDVAYYIAQRYGNKITVITYNGSSAGITLSGNGLPKHPIKIGNSHSTYSEGVHKLPGCHIGKVITWLYNNGGVKKFPRIITLAGKMADRGISFGANNFSECKNNKKLWWHLTELYLIVPPSTTQSNLLQVAGRLCGVYNDNVPLTLYTNVGKDIVNSYWVQEELIERARSQYKKKYLMGDALTDIKIQRDKCVKGRRFVSKGISYQPQKVKDDSKYGGWNWEQEGKTYFGTNAQFGNGQRKVEVRPMVVKEEVKDTSKYDMEIKEGLDYIKRAYHNPKITYIRKIVDKYQQKGFIPLTRQELASVIGYKFRLSNYDRWDVEHNRYKLITKNKDKKYELSEEIKKYLSL